MEILLNPSRIPKRLVLTFPFNKWGNTGLERLSNLPHTLNSAECGFRCAFVWLRHWVSTVLTSVIVKVTEEPGSAWDKGSHCQKQQERWWEPGWWTGLPLEWEEHDALFSPLKDSTQVQNHSGMKIWAFEVGWLHFNHVPKNLSSFKDHFLCTCIQNASRVQCFKEELLRCSVLLLHNPCIPLLITSKFVEIMASRDWEDENQEKWSWFLLDHVASWNFRVGVKRSGWSRLKTELCILAAIYVISSGRNIKINSF